MTATKPANDDKSGRKTVRKMGRPSRYSDARGTIRKAALELFAELGFDATSVGHIAKAANLPKANVLYYFSDKETLWKEAIDHHWAEVDAYYAERRPAKPTFSREELEHALIVYLEACHRFPPYVQLMSLEGHAKNWRTQWLAERHLRRHFEGAQRYCKELIRRKVVKDMDPLVLQTMLTGGGQLLVGQSQLWGDAIGIDPSSPEFRKSYAKSVVERLCK